MLDAEIICPDLLFDTNLSTSENLNVEVANFLSKEAIYRANSIGDAMSAYYKMFFIHGSLYHGEGIPSLTLPIVLIALLMFKEIKELGNYHVWMC